MPNTTPHSTAPADRRPRFVREKNFAENLRTWVDDNNTPHYSWQPGNDGIIVEKDKEFGTDKKAYEAFRRKMYDWGFVAGLSPRSAYHWSSAKKEKGADYWHHRGRLFVREDSEDNFRLLQEMGYKKHLRLLGAETVPTEQEEKKSRGDQVPIGASSQGQGTIATESLTTEEAIENNDLDEESSAISNYYFEVHNEGERDVIISTDLKFTPQLFDDDIELDTLVCGSKPPELEGKFEEHSVLSGHNQHRVDGEIQSRRGDGDHIEFVDSLTQTSTTTEEKLSWVRRSMRDKKRLRPAVVATRDYEKASPPSPVDGGFYEPNVSPNPTKYKRKIATRRSASGTCAFRGTHHDSPLTKDNFLCEDDLGQTGARTSRIGKRKYVWMAGMSVLLGGFEILFHSWTQSMDEPGPHMLPMIAPADRKFEMVACPVCPYGPIIFPDPSVRLFPFGQNEWYGSLDCRGLSLQIGGLVRNSNDPQGTCLYWQLVASVPCGCKYSYPRAPCSICADGSLPPPDSLDREIPVEFTNNSNKSRTCLDLIVDAARADHDNCDSFDREAEYCDCPVHVPNTTAPSLLPFSAALATGDPSTTLEK